MQTPILIASVSSSFEAIYYGSVQQQAMKDFTDTRVALVIHFN